MADFVFSGGCRWNDLCAVDVKVGADGTPISCKNPITGAEISGGGTETATITLTWNPGVTEWVATAPVVTEEGIIAVGTFKSTDTEITVPLYEGKATIYVDDVSTCVIGSGDLELDSENYAIIVSGDGTIIVIS